MMDDALKHRLVGAAVLIAGALLLSFLLPQPDGLPELEPGQQRVSFNLNEPPPVTITEIPSREEIPPGDVAAEPEPAAVEETTAPPPEESAGEAPAETPAASASSSQISGDTPLPGVPTLKLDQDLSNPPPPKPAAVKPEPAKPAVEKPPVTKPVPEKPVVVAEKPRPAEKPVDKPAAKPVEKPVEKTAEKPATAAKPGEKPWYVQLGSFGEIGNARQLLDKLKPAGFKGLISPAETAKGTLYRARVGPYPDRAAAEAARSKLAGQGVSGGTVVQE